jgi:hypothetical protein
MRRRPRKRTMNKCLLLAFSLLNSNPTGKKCTYFNMSMWKEAVFSILI